MTHTPGTPASSTLAPSPGPARYQQIDQGQLDAWRRKGSRNIGFGILWLVAGLLITVITMSSSAGHHGFYIIAFGPIIGGAIQILSGYRTHRRGTVTPPSPATPLAPAHRPSTPASSRSQGGPAGPSRPAARSSSPSAGAWHPARSITRGMSREELHRRLGEPTKPPITTAELHRDATVVGGLSRGTEPAWDKEFWLYQDTPPGHDTEITLDHTRSVEDVNIRPHNDTDTDVTDPASPSAPAPGAEKPRADLASWAEAVVASATADPADPGAAADLATADKAPTGPAVSQPAAPPAESTTPEASPHSAHTPDSEPPSTAEPEPEPTSEPASKITSELASDPTIQPGSESVPVGTPRLLRRSAVRAQSAGDLAQARVLHRQVIDTGHAAVAPLSMLDLARLVYRLNEVDAARALFQNAIDSGHPDAAPQALYGLARLLQQLKSSDTGADVLLSQAIATEHPDTAPRATHDLALLHKRRGNTSVARQYLEQVITSGHTDAAPLAMNNLGLIHESAGELDDAAALYQRAADTGHPEQANMGRANLERLKAAPTRSAVPPAAPPRSAAVATGAMTSRKARRHSWAEELMEEHLTKVEQNTPDLATRASFSLLRRPDVLDYVMSGDRAQWSTGRVGTRGALFDGLYVAVSNVPTHRPNEIRELLLPEGYNRLLHRLITESRTIDKKIDVVHWTLGTSPRGWAVHLLYMPPPNAIPLSWDKGVPTLFPWDLFQPEERPRSMRHEF